MSVSSLHDQIHQVGLLYDDIQILELELHPFIDFIQDFEIELMANTKLLEAGYDPFGEGINSFARVNENQFSLILDFLIALQQRRINIFGKILIDSSHFIGKTLQISIHDNQLIIGKSV